MTHFWILVLIFGLELFVVSHDEEKIMHCIGGGLFAMGLTGLIQSMGAL